MHLVSGGVDDPDEWGAAATLHRPAIHHHHDNPPGCTHGQPLKVTQGLVRPHTAPCTTHTSLNTSTSPPPPLTTRPHSCKSTACRLCRELTVHRPAQSLSHTRPNHSHTNHSHPHHTQSSLTPSPHTQSPLTPTPHTQSHPPTSAASERRGQQLLHLQSPHRAALQYPALYP